jgi:uncharacterized protein (DUF2126 family)
MTTPPELLEAAVEQARADAPYSYSRLELPAYRALVDAAPEANLALAEAYRALEDTASRYHIHARINNTDPVHTELLRDCESPHCKRNRAALSSITQLAESHAKAMPDDDVYQK